jgi:hypothetical protein
VKYILRAIDDYVELVMAVCSAWQMARGAGESYPANVIPFEKPPAEWPAH